MTLKDEFLEHGPFDEHRRWTIEYGQVRNFTAAIVRRHHGFRYDQFHIQATRDVVSIEHARLMPHNIDRFYQALEAAMVAHEMLRLCKGRPKS